MHDRVFGLKYLPTILVHAASVKQVVRLRNLLSAQARHYVLSYPKHDEQFSSHSFKV